MTDLDFRMIDSGREGIQRLVGEPIPTTDLKPGVIPLEMDIIGGGNETIYKMDGNNLILMGHKHGSRNYPEGPGATHYGHPVTEVIKTVEEDKAK